MEYLILGVYLLGCIVHYRMFMKSEEHLIDGWALVFIGFYFSMLSWIAVLITIAFTSKSKPPKWLTFKK